MSLFPAYASATYETPPVSTPSESFQFSSFQQPSLPEKEPQTDEDVIVIDEKEKSDKDVEIIGEKSGSRSPDRRQRRRERKHKKEKRKRRRRSSSTSSENEPSSAKKNQKPTETSQPIQKWALLKEVNPVLPDQKLFIVDNRRDVENFQYDTIYKGHLAKFVYRVKRCVGCNSQRINRLLFGQDATDGNLKTRRYFSRRNRNLLQSNATNMPVAVNQANRQPSSSEALPEFLPVDNKIKMDGKTLIYDPKLQMYRPLDDHSKDEEAVDEPIASSSNLENKRLNVLLTENPHDMKLWKELIRHQDRIFSMGGGWELEKSSSNIAILERKLSIVEKAIEKNSTNVELKLLRLHLGRESGWDYNRLRDEWRRLEFTHVNDPTVWIGRIRFELGGEFSRFTFSRHNFLYDHCLERFFAAASGQLVTHPPPKNAEEWLIDFLMAKVVFLFDSGHVEQAIACVQAMMEFNFEMNPTLESVPLNERRQFFEPFWDSNQPRIGEDGAVGWAETMKLRLDPPEPTTESTTDEDKICKEGATMRDAGLWLQLERVRESKHWLPWRGVEEPEDAQRIVLFDDIVSVLYEVKDPSKRFLLVVKAFVVCGMQLPKLSSATGHGWYNEEILYEALDHFQLLPQFHRPAYDKGEEFLERMLFEGAKLFHDIPMYESYFLCGWFHHTAVSLARSEMSNKEKIRQYKKVVKRVLDDDQRRDCVIFYYGYAIGLVLLGAYKEAADVADTALTAAKTNQSLIDHLAVLKLVSIWTECKMLQKGWSSTLVVDRLATWILKVLGSKAEVSRTSESSGISASQILKAKKYLSDRLVQWTEKPLETEEERFLTSWLGSIGMNISHISALFNYVCKSGDLESSRKFYIEGRQLLKQASSDDETSILLKAEIEHLWDHEIRLINHHLRSTPSFSSRLLTSRLEEALEEFPSKVSFLKLYVDSHLRGQLMAKLRRFFDHRHEYWTENETHSLEVSWVAAVYGEFSRYVKLKDEQMDETYPSNLVPEPKRLQNVLARALESCPNSVLLWRLRMKLESYLGGERALVKQTFYLAIRQCPWAKELYMDAISLLPDEGQSIVDLMIEKGLRVRVPWEELLLLRKAMEKDTGRSVETEIDRSVEGTDRSMEGIDRSVEGINRSSEGTDQSLEGTDRALEGEGQNPLEQESVQSLE